MVSSLYELFALTVVSLGIVAKLNFLWESLGVACALLGMVITASHNRAYSSHGSEVRADVIQHRLNFLPWFSYGALLIASCWGFATNNQETPLAIASLVVIWLLISGCFETFLTLSPNFLQPEPRGEHFENADNAVGTAQSSDSA